jgi:succinate dehydrogenase / fumarate reductase cytochrome b subunit
MSLKALWQSTIGKKVVMSISGILLMLFLIVHLAGNLTLFIPDGGDVFNAYAHMLESLGPLLYIAEAGLLAIFLFHVVAAVQVHLSKKRARAGHYATIASKGGPSKMSVASRSMIITGIILFIFIPGHIWLFKFNAGTPHPMVDVDGEQVKNLYEVVVTAFMRPAVAFWYTTVMLFLGFHMRHGFWSALQSLGAMSPRLTPVIYTAGLVFAILLAGGFLVIPLYFFFFGETLLAGGGS